MSLASVFDDLDLRQRTGFVQRIQGLMKLADLCYASSADGFGFRCQGCGENCCEQRFSHYTLSEYLLMSEGLATLDNEARGRLSEAAFDARERIARDEDRVACPLITGGRCGLYAYRPMICRLHGVPHVLAKPGGGELSGDGCHRFAVEARVPGLDECRLDRTPLYSRMAALEIDLRAACGFRDKVRMTVADMIADCRGSSSGSRHETPIHHVAQKGEFHEHP